MTPTPDRAACRIGGGTVRGRVVVGKAGGTVADGVGRSTCMATPGLGGAGAAPCGF
ncbi:hypothetical protein GCM10010199_15660 [Dactylosporangium roseum]